METINDRIRQVRKNANQTQGEFGKSIGLSRGNITNIEVNRINVTDRTIVTICKVYGVSETWLRTGIGNMYSSGGADAEFDMICTQIQLSDDSFIKNALRAYWRLEEKEKAVIRKLIDDLAAESKQ